MSRRASSAAVELTARIREAAGPDIEILIDAHGRFNVPTAVRLCRVAGGAGGDRLVRGAGAAGELPRAAAGAREGARARSRVGERLHTRWDFVPILENRLADFVMPDVTWTGGISELKKIATLAEAYYVPISPHDASGPINVVAGAQVMMTVPNFYRVETSRYDLSSYNRLLKEPLDNSGGELKLSREPGLGIDFDLAYLRASVIDGIGG